MESGAIRMALNDFRIAHASAKQREAMARAADILQEADEREKSAMSERSQRILANVMKQMGASEVRMGIAVWKNNAVEAKHEARLAAANLEIQSKMTAQGKRILAKVGKSLGMSSLRSTVMDMRANAIGSKDKLNRDAIALLDRSLAEEKLAGEQRREEARKLTTAANSTRENLQRLENKAKSQAVSMLQGVIKRLVHGELKVTVMDWAANERDAERQGMYYEMQAGLEQIAGKDKAAQEKAIKMLRGVFRRMEGGEVRVVMSDMRGNWLASEPSAALNSKLVTMFELAERRAGMYQQEIDRLREEHIEQVEAMSTDGTTVGMDRHKRRISNQLAQAGGDLSLTEEPTYEVIGGLENHDEIFRLKQVSISTRF